MGLGLATCPGDPAMGTLQQRIATAGATIGDAARPGGSAAQEYLGREAIKVMKRESSQRICNPCHFPVVLDFISRFHLNVTNQ